MKKLMPLIVALVMGGGSLLAGDSKSGSFLNEFTIPLLAKPPVIDGTFSAEEWRGCVAFDGLTQASGPKSGQLEERSGRTYIGATADAFYVALVTELPDGGGSLVAEIKKDIFKIVMDDSLEVWIDPDPTNDKMAAFQAIFNSLGNKVYTTHSRGGFAAVASWDGKFEIKNGFTSNRWVTEIRIPLESIVPGRKSTDGVWGISVCRNWKQPWSQASAPGCFRGSDTRFTFVNESLPIVSLEQLKDPFARDIETKLSVYNSSKSELTLKARIDLERNTMPTLTKSSELKVAPEGTQSIILAQKEANSDGFGQVVEVTSADGKTVYYKRKTDWGKPREKRWDTTVVKKLPVDFTFGYYPYKNKLRLVADISGLPKEAQVEEVTVKINKQWSAKVIAAVSLKDFNSDGLKEISLALPDLDEDIYEIAVQAKGKNVPKDALVKTFVRKHYPWEKTPMGRSTKVYPPFTPIEIQGKTIKTILRTHQVNDLGLLNQVNAANKNLLAAPMTFHAKLEGREAPISAAPIHFVKTQANEAITESSFRAGALDASAKATWDVDGTVKYELTLNSSGGKKVDEFILDIPLDDGQASLIHAMSSGIRKGPISELVDKGQGVVWDSKRLITGEMPEGFCSYIFLGNGNRGLCWFAENDRNWSWDRKTPNMQIVRNGSTLCLRICLINKSTVINTPRTITFGILAAPIKPVTKTLKACWPDNRIELLWTSINWLAGPGVCGNVYPVGRDPYFWQMIARSSVEKLTQDEIEKTAERGRHYFEPYGEDSVKEWNRHVLSNLGGRTLGKQMIFYYNRATTSCDEEYATFADEWLLGEMPGHDRKVEDSEQKLVPSESYIDFALYWYKKSFEYGKNTGVYLDNWFLAPSYNLEMTDAYRDEKGEIIPATGLWELRELCKRTFIMMNEEGMEPRIFPHMTSTSILPMLSFATMQLDWEWKSGEGDTQNRFSREYLQLATSGKLAGVVSIPLSSHGFSKDNIFGMRTYTGVPMIHDAVFYDVISSSGNKTCTQWVDGFVAGLGKHLTKPGLKTWRYWDDEAQPVTTRDPDLPVIVHSVPGDETWVVLCGYAEEDRPATLFIDSKRLELGDHYAVTNVETGQNYPVKNNTVSIEVKRHEVIGFKLKNN